MWKQPKYPSMDDWMVHKHNRILLSHKKKWNTAICENMDGPWVYHAKKISQTENDKNYMTAFIYGI